jgi:hypothetical protein
MDGRAGPWLQVIHHAECAVRESAPHDGEQRHFYPPRAGFTLSSFRTFAI